MYQIEFSQRQSWLREMPFAATPGQAFDTGDVARVVSLEWEEHCVECATPECFDTCPLHAARSDGACARFEHGIVPNEAFGGLFDYGADIRLRRWGKLEARLTGATSFKPPFGSREPGFVSKTTNPLEVTEALLKCDELVVECWSPEDAPFSLLLEYFVLHPGGRESRFRGSVLIKPGRNLHRLPVASLRLDPDHPNGFINIAPDHPDQRFVLTWLDFVKYNASGEASGMEEADVATNARQPAAMVKCVAWDLDNTLWDGVLINGIDVEANVRPETVAAIHALDERGVLQTVISKNDWQQGWDALGRLGLQEYLLHPAINWGQKSENLRRVAERLNIALDTFALVDDSPFEREEVVAALPEVRVYSDQEIATLLERPELDLPITDASRKRRLSYVSEVQREEIRAAFTGDYFEFLRSCGLVMRLFRPSEERHLTRCWELLQRSNQLNLSGTRYERAAFGALVSGEGIVPVAFDCQDRFGDYGVVGYATLDEGGQLPILRDLVISCRVAQKRVEQAFLAWLARRYAERGLPAVEADLFLGGRNALITKALHKGGFGIASMDGKRMRMRRRLAGMALGQLEAELAAEPLTVREDASLGRGSLV